MKGGFLLIILCCILEIAVSSRASAKDDAASPATLVANGDSLALRGGDENLENAFRLYEQAAAAGNAMGMYHVGRAYLYGIGVAKDPAKAAAWFLRGSTLGNAQAINGLGVCYNNGIGVGQDVDKAIQLFSAAAAAGDTHAMVNLGISYQNGDGVAKNESKAFALFQNAATAGDLNGMVYLGLCYENGDGVATDGFKALDLFRKAAEGETLNGDAPAPDYVTMIESIGDPWTRNAEEARNLPAHVSNDAWIGGLGSYENTIDLAILPMVARLKRAGELLAIGRHMVEVGQSMEDDRMSALDQPYITSERDIDGSLRIVQHQDGPGIFDYFMHGVVGIGTGMAADATETRASDARSTVLFRIINILHNVYPPCPQEKKMITMGIEREKVSFTNTSGHALHDMTIYAEMSHFLSAPEPMAFRVLFVPELAAGETIYISPDLRRNNFTQAYHDGRFTRPEIAEQTANDEEKWAATGGGYYKANLLVWAREAHETDDVINFPGACERGAEYEMQCIRRVLIHLPDATPDDAAADRAYISSAVHRIVELLPANAPLVANAQAIANNIDAAVQNARSWRANQINALVVGRYTGEYSSSDGPPGSKTEPLVLEIRRLPNPTLYRKLEGRLWNPANPKDVTIYRGNAPEVEYGENRMTFLSISQNPFVDRLDLEFNGNEVQDYGLSSAENLTFTRDKAPATQASDNASATAASGTAAAYPAPDIASVAPSPGIASAGPSPAIAHSPGSSIADAEKRAIQRFPDLASPGTPLNLEFVRRYQEYQAWKKSYFADPDWPSKLAAECQQSILATPRPPPGGVIVYRDPPSTFVQACEFVRTLSSNSNYSTLALAGGGTMQVWNTGIIAQINNPQAGDGSDAQDQISVLQGLINRYPDAQAPLQRALARWQEFANNQRAAAAQPGRPSDLSSEPAGNEGDYAAPSQGAPVASAAGNGNSPLKMESLQGASLLSGGHRGETSASPTPWVNPLDIPAQRAH